MLVFLGALALAASAAHFAHNALYLASYPGPDWIPGPGFVVVTWLILAAALLVGLRWYTRGHRRKGTAAVAAYCVSCALVFGHYLYGPPSHFSVASNAFILFEGITGALLGAHLTMDVVRSRRAGISSRA